MAIQLDIRVHQCAYGDDLVKNPMWIMTQAADQVRTRVRTDPCACMRLSMLRSTRRGTGKLHKQARHTTPIRHMHYDDDEHTTMNDDDEKMMH